MTRHLDTALLAAREGLSTVPPKEDGTKAPLGSWKKYQTTPADETQIRKWYQNGRQGVGLVCGEVSGGLEMLEFEGRAVHDGIQNRFKELAEEAGLGDVLAKIRSGYVERTPSDGAHVLYRCAEVDGNLQLARRITDDGEIQVLIETRGEGGYTVVAPSSGPVHETGKPYVMVRGGLESIPTITPEERRDLLNLARSLDEMPEEPRDSYDWGQATNRSRRPGDIYNDRATGADVVALLERHGWERVHQYGDRTHLRRPGKTIGVSATVFDSGVFVCFTTSTRFDGYDQSSKRGVYSPFGVYTILEHGGDYSAAARALNPEATVRLPASEQSTLESGSDLPPHIPAEFWTERPALSHIRDAAHSRGRSADAVLVAVLARVCADTRHTVRLPAIVGSSCGLSLFPTNVGPPGSGKSTGAAIATELVPAQIIRPECDGVAPGSGEGLIEMLFDFVEEGDGKKKRKVHRQVRHNAYMYVDEGETLAKLSARSGSTLLPTIRTAFTSGVLGQANASIERKRIVPAGQAVFGIVLGIQPDYAGPLFDEAGAGTPQRLLWASTQAPTPPPGERPEWPGILPRPSIEATAWSRHEVKGSPYVWHEVGIPAPIRDEVAQRDHHRQQHGTPPLDEHIDLIQLKVSVALALLEGRLDVVADDWELAAVICNTSRKVRDHIHDHIRAMAETREAASAERAARRQVTVSKRTQDWRIVDTAEKFARRVIRHPGDYTVGKLRSAASEAQREVFDEALDHAIAEGWIEERTEDGQGTPKRRLHPGGTRP